MRKRPSSNALNSFFLVNVLLIFLFFVFSLLFANYFSYRNVLIGQKNVASTFTRVPSNQHAEYTAEMEHRKTNKKNCSYKREERALPHAFNSQA